MRVLTRGKVLFPEEAPGSGLGRATCSSTMKEAKFPDALDLAPGATDSEGLSRVSSRRAGGSSRRSRA